MNCDIVDFDRFLSSWIAKKYTSTSLAKYILEEKKLYQRITTEKVSPNGPVLSKNDTHFLDVIEPWVRDMVLYFIESLWLITYCSCQWHQHLSSQEKWYIDERYIKVLFLSKDSRDTIQKIFQHIIDTYPWDTSIILPKVLAFDEKYSWKLLSQDSIYCLQINFSSEKNNVIKYFDAIENVYNEFLDYMKIFFDTRKWKE